MAEYVWYDRTVKISDFVHLSCVMYE